MRLFCRLSIISFLFYASLCAQEDRCFHDVYPLNGFKKVVDTCMRSYSDALLLHDCISNHERSDDLLDLLVGRLMRLESYVQQLIYAYTYEATVSFDELDYLIRMLDYLEITIAESGYQQLCKGLNSITGRLKKDLKKVIGVHALQSANPMPELPYRCQPLEGHLPQFA